MDRNLRLVAGLSGAFMACFAVFASAEVVSAQKVPNLQTIASLETGLRLPKGAKPLASYDRYHAYTVVDGRTMIAGTLIGTRSGLPGKISLLSDLRQAPIVMDGGCNVIHLWWDPKTAHISAIACNGYA
jgi:hypothetical protein